MSLLTMIETAFTNATAAQTAARLATLGDRATAGPEEQRTILVPHPAHPEFVNGFWVHAKRTDANPSRVGGYIDPEVVVDHTTDMHPDDWAALVRSWQERAGDGACAHFLVGRDEAHGVLQLVSITRNGNHAGGPHHGVYVDPAHPDVLIHPNTIAIGIEFHCAGGQVRLRADGAYNYVEDGVIHGAPIPAADVEPDPVHPGRGWHKLSAYQEGVRKQLHDALDSAMHPLRAGLKARAVDGEAVPYWGVSRSARFSGHVTLNPRDRSDPWPNGMRAIAL